METAAVVAATLAVLALIGLAVKAYLVLVRAQAALDRFSRLLDEEVAPTMRGWAEAARGVQRAAGKLENGLALLGSSLGRVERLSEKLEPHVLTVAALQPAIARVSAWLSGMRKGLAEGGEARPKGQAVAEGVETEVE